MTTFFDATSTAHLSLIVRAMRTHIDLPVVAEQAESDVIEQYTLRRTPAEDYSTNFYLGRGYSLGNGVYICLEGFNPDAAAVTDASLVKALRWTIADVISWRLTQYAENPQLSSSGHQASAKAFREDAFDRFPPKDWDWRLRRWDLRPPQYVIG